MLFVLLIPLIHDSHIYLESRYLFSSYFKDILTLIVYLNLPLSPFINNFWSSAHTQVELTGGNSSFSLTQFWKILIAQQSPTSYAFHSEDQKTRFTLSIPGFSGWFQRDKRNESGESRKKSNKRKLFITCKEHSLWNI